MANSQQSWELLNFEKGMVEAGVADKGDERIILMINWNPTINVAGLVRRQGSSLLFDSLRAQTSVAFYSDGLAAELLPYSPQIVDPRTGAYVSVNNIYTAFDIPANIPVGHTSYHFFCSQNIQRSVGGNPPVGVLGVATFANFFFNSSATPNESLTLAYSWWNFPHSELAAPRAGLAAPGKQVVGLYQDHCFYGQSALFVTDPRPIQSSISTGHVSLTELYPAYQYKFHDYTFLDAIKQRDPKLYMNGSPIVPYTGINAQHWKVEDLGFEAINVFFSRTDRLPGTRTWYNETDKVYYDNVSIISQEYPSYRGKDLPVWRSGVSTGTRAEHLFPISTKPSERVSLLMNPDTSYTDNAGLAGIAYIDEAEPAGFKKDWWPKIWWPLGASEVVGSNVDNYYQRPRITAFEDSSGSPPELETISTENYREGFLYADTQPSYFVYYDYSSAANPIPRPFHSQEPIPWKLTAVVNGIEKEIKSGVYLEEELIPYFNNPPTVTVPKQALYKNKKIRIPEGEIASKGEGSVHWEAPFVNVSYKNWNNPTEFPDTGSNYVSSVFAAPKNCFVKFELNFVTKADRPPYAAFPIGLTSFKLYVSTPSTRAKNIDKYVSLKKFNKYQFPGLIKPQVGESVVSSNVMIRDAEVLPFDRDIYRPDAVAEGFESYKLVKEFLILGESQPFSKAERERFRYTDQGVVGVSSNGWTRITFNELGVDYHRYVATPVNENGDVMTDQDQIDRAEDFYLWDYPTTGPDYTNTLGTLAEPWKGKGARLITNIKGRTFLGGPIGEYFQEEVGRVRFSAEQNGVLSIGDFGELDFIDLGKYPHTALASFREQLWTFSETEIYRVQMHDLLESGRWEILEKIEGQGTFHQKAVEVTPYGVVWCNRNGVWISDGREPQLISTAINNTYRWLAAESTPRYAGMQSPDVLARNPDETYNNLFAFKGQWNRSIEVTYDSSADEIVVSFNVEDNSTEFTEMPPFRYEEVRLHYSFRQQCWWIETHSFPMQGLTKASRWITYSTLGKLKSGRDGLMSFYICDIDSDVTTSFVHHKGYKYIASQTANPAQPKYVQDEFLMRRRTANPTAGADLVVYQNITSSLGFSHLGDGISDSVMHSVAIGGTLVEQTPTVITPHSTQLFLETRQPYYPDGSTSAYIRQAIVDGAGAWSNWRNYPQVLQSPVFALSATRVQRESTIYLCPIATFRRARMFLFTNVMATLDNVIATYTTSKRKTYS